MKSWRLEFRDAIKEKEAWHVTVSTRRHCFYTRSSSIPVERPADIVADRVICACAYVIYTRHIRIRSIPGVALSSLDCIFKYNRNYKNKSQRERYPSFTRLYKIEEKRGKRKSHLGHPYARIMQYRV